MHEDDTEVAGTSATGEEMPQVVNAPPLRRLVKRRTLAVEVTETLRDMILTGELTPGRRITQEELTHIVGVSTMPVREALLRLAAEGFVEAAPNRSFTIARTSLADVRDIYWVHATLAKELTRRACVRADEALVQSLEELAARCVDALGRDDLEGLRDANWAFHRTINHAADAPKLLICLRTMLRFIPRDLYARLPEWGRASQKGHTEMLDAFRERDAEAAGQAAERHVREAGEILIQAFSTKGYWAGSDSP